MRHIPVEENGCFGCTREAGVRPGRQVPSQGMEAGTVTTRHVDSWIIPVLLCEVYHISDFLSLNGFNSSLAQTAPAQPVGVVINNRRLLAPDGTQPISGSCLEGDRKVWGVPRRRASEDGFVAAVGLWPRR